MLLRQGGFSRRDATLLLVGASAMHIWYLFFSHGSTVEPYITLDMDTTLSNPSIFTTTKTLTQKQTIIHTATATVTTKILPTSHAVQPYDEIPSTKVLAHAPGWTLFRNLYMSNGTLFVVVDEKARERLPEIRMMVSTPLEAFASPENIAAREPTPSVMTVINRQEATSRWTTINEEGERLNRLWTVEGNTLLSWDPKQFLRHYYHFVAEFFLGVQAFWHGAFSKPVPVSTSPHSSHFSVNHPAVPPIHRLIFAYSNADGWRDDPGFNAYFLRAVLPSLTIEHEEDWADRITATRPVDDDTNERAFHFPIVLLVDRSAAFRGHMCGSVTQRTAAEAWEYMRIKGKLMGMHIGGWWSPIRGAIWRFAGAEAGVKHFVSSDAETSFLTSDVPDVVGIDTPSSNVVDIGGENQKLLPLPEKIVISYISRQATRHRKLVKEDHDVMVQALKELVGKKNKERQDVIYAIDGRGGDPMKLRTIPPEWEFSELEAEKLTKEDQIKASARTTFLIGVHGNGLTHLIFMNPNRYSTVIEIFYPGGFAHDYEWTTRALGMTHLAVWNDTHRAYADKPEVSYPDGFQGNSIPVYGSYITQIIEDRVDDKLETKTSPREFNGQPAFHFGGH